MTSTPVDTSLSGEYTANNLGIDVDDTGNVKLLHEDSYVDFEGHQITLSLADVSTLLTFLDTPRGRRVQELARSAAAPVAATESFADAWRALPRDAQERIGARMAAHARQVVATPELAHLAERPEIAALLAAQHNQPAGTGAEAQVAPAGKSSDPLAAFTATGAAFADLQRRAAHPHTRQAQRMADHIAVACSMAKVKLDDPRFVAYYSWMGWHEGIGFLLLLRALADHPDALVQMVTAVADVLQRNLFTDEPVDPEADTPGSGSTAGPERAAGRATDVWTDLPQAQRVQLLEALVELVRAAGISDGDLVSIGGLPDLIQGLTSEQTSREA